MSLFEFVLSALAVWRVSYMLTSEVGPFDIFYNLRKTRLGLLLDCIYCTSVWVALLPAAVFFFGWQHAVLIWLALSSAAIFLEETRRRLEV